MSAVGPVLKAYLAHRTRCGWIKLFDPPSDHPGCRAIWKHVLIIRGLAMLVSHAVQGLENHINAINMPDLFSICRFFIGSIEAAGAL